ncbi:SubName: Full=Uncharacterized protein {ECO:0000313/EMBL:CCA67336.1} [Serendipita indica DSM 11827]|nr:SubName: Full=Uncharacterized protein {ECO:0000313/EMBL:CCA67336.1} [Serendipita indica DSM 11827]
MSEELQKLQNEKHTLSTQLNVLFYDPLRKEHNTLGDAVARPLIQNYNKTVSKILDLLKILDRKRDPLAMLPGDIWVEILHLVMAESDAGLPAFDRLTLLRRVSPHWARLIAEQPSLWTNIDLRLADYPSSREKMRLFIHLQRSGDLNLSLNANFAASEWRTVVEPLILPHADRVRFILHLRPTEDTLDSVIRTLSPFKQLEHVRLPRETDTFIPRFTVNLMGFLARNPQLKRFDGVAIDASRLELNTSQPEAGTRSNPLVVTEGLPWTELKYWQRDHGTLFDMLSQAPHLIRLTASISLALIHPLLCALRFAPLLNTLHLLIQGDGSTPVEVGLSIPASDQCLVSVLNLNLDIDATVVLAPATTVKVGRRNRPKQTYIDSLLLYFPRVQKAQISRSVPSEPYPFFLDSLSHLRDLTCTSGIIPYRKDMAASLVIHSLRIGCDANVFKTVDIPTLESLEFFLTYDALPNSSDASHLDFAAGRWLHLTRLSIHLSRNPGETEVSFDLPALNTFEIYTVRGGTSGFLCQSIAQRPEALPSLERLTIKDHLLDWDVIFILLERRILTSTVIPIRSLTLTLTPSDLIRNTLIDRLQGLITYRPPSLKLSVDHIAKVLLQNNKRVLKESYRIISLTFL